MRRTIVLAGVILTAAVMPAASQSASSGQNVLHAGLLYDSLRPMDVGTNNSGELEASKPPVIAGCVLAIGDKACVGVWRWRKRQGIVVNNLTGGYIQVRLQGCEIRNGAQTIVIDDTGLGHRGVPDGPYQEDFEPGAWSASDFIDPAGGSTFPLEGMRPFGKGMTMTCRTATATPAP